jgi:very-short-patch-repair endonuclease
MGAIRDCKIPPLQGEGHAEGEGGAVMPTNKSADIARIRARHLRRTTTDAEKKLWQQLRRFEINGSHFRRQVPIGPYIADFACMAARLIVEVDGSQHAEDRKQRHDEARTRWLAKEGYRVLRVWNNDIMRNMSGVMETVYAAVYGSTAAPAVALKHQRRSRNTRSHFPTLARDARRPSPCRGG